MSRFVYGTDQASAMALLSGAPLSITAAEENLNYPRPERGFYLATHYATAEDFALRAGSTAGGGKVLLYQFTEDAFAAVSAAGGKFRAIIGMMRYPGQEYFVPPRAFAVFDAERAAGRIAVTDVTGQE